MRSSLRCAGSLLLLLLLLAAPAWAQQSAVITGRVTDAGSGQALPGANVVLSPQGSLQMAAGTATNNDGSYRLAGLAPGAYTLRVSYIGYQQAELPVTLAVGESRTVDVSLQPGIDLKTVVVTASRQQEKVLDAPASVSVVDTRELEQAVAPTATAALRNVTAVDVATTGVDRQEIVLRGFNNAFSGAAYALVDYRQGAVPALGVNIYGLMPITSLDVERIEVVRGPGSALYGAGVDAGVIHFFTKDPFTYPGTTVSLMGGERSLFGGMLRHAGTFSNNTVGYKIVGEYTQAEDWDLDPDDPLDKAQLDRDLVPRNYDYEKYKVNGELHFKPSSALTVIANGGYAVSTATVLSGIGTVQADNFGYTYGQLRVQAGNFFVQAYINANQAGESFNYGQGDAQGNPLPVVDNGKLYNAQAQYTLNLWNDRQSFILGADAELLRPDTEGTIYGRNEDDDAISETGAYVQSTTAISDKLDLTLALRGDYNNIVEELRFSPRAALVVKPSPSHTFRATYNRAFSSPGANSNFLDIQAARLPGSAPIVVRGRGAAFGYTFERNAAYAGLPGSTSDLVASSLNGCFPTPTPACGTAQPVGLPLDAVYGSVYAGISAIPAAQLTAILQAQGLPVNQQVVQQLVALLNPQLTRVQGFSPGALGKLNLTTLRFDPVTDAVDVDPLAQTTSSTFEVGYKGILQNRLLLAVDAYYVQKKDFIGPLLMETPMVFVPRLSADLTAAIGAGIQGNAQLAGALAQLGLTPAQVAALLVNLAGSSLPSATTPVAIVQPRENNPGTGQVPELLLTYRNYGDVDYYGVDAAMQLIATDRLSFFGNVSIVNDDFFDNEELGEENTNLALALNAPKLKFKLGGDYRVPGSFSVNLSGRYSDGYPVRSGPYVGDVESYFLLDVGAGYDFSRSIPGLRLDVLVQNVLNNEHREFIGAPEIGRMGIARLTYDF